MNPTFSLAAPRAWRRVPAFAAAAIAFALVAGCAAGPNPRDPLEPFNRHVMEFNEGVDAVALKPAAVVYRRAVPPLVRTGVSNFFGNLTDAWSFVNAALQFKLQAAAENFMRVNVNTFFGLGGVLDLACELNIERHKEDFGQTLGRWGVPAGPYIVLPLLGPSTLRDTVALPVDRYGDPIHYVTPWEPRYELYAARAVDTRANLLRLGNVFEQAALDKYSFQRDAYLQKRRADIFDDEKRVDGNAGKEPKADGEAAPGAAPKK